MNAILDDDPAALYGVETNVRTQSVRRNIERFPADFVFELTWGDPEWVLAGGLHP